MGELLKRSIRPQNVTQLTKYQQEIIIYHVTSIVVCVRIRRNEATEERDIKVEDISTGTIAMLATIYLIVLHQQFFITTSQIKIWYMQISNDSNTC